MRMTILASGAALLLWSAAPCVGDIVTFTGGTLGDGTEWSVAANWDTNSVPTDEDRAVIPFDFHVEVDGDFTVDTIEIEADASLTILVGKTLTLENDTDNLGGGLLDPPGSTCAVGDNSLIDGSIVIQSSDVQADGGTLAITKCNHRLSGDGFVRGQGEHAQITIADEKVLINQLGTFGIVGGMVIAGDGKLRNSGLVEAEGKLVIQTLIGDVPGAVWATGCKDTMVFETGSLALSGDFTELGVWDDGPGVFEFNEPVSTCGVFRYDCGWVEINGANTFFEYADFEDLTGFGACPNPGSGGPGGCEDPWVIDSDVFGALCQ